jgi:flagellar basal body P-ring formation protein FlgA
MAVEFLDVFGLLVPGREVMSKFASPTPGAAAPVPRRAFAGRACRWQQHVLVRSVAACALAAGAASGAGVVHAQETGGPIMIPGPSETNPAAVVAMARNAGIAVDGKGDVSNAAGGSAAGSSAFSAGASTAPSASASPSVSTPGSSRGPSGYRSAASAADAAMRAAALALDARADAADADSGAATDGLIVIPGSGAARAPVVPARPALAMTPSRSAGVASNSPPADGGMIEIPGNGEPKTSSISSSVPAASGALPRVAVQASVSARDVMPVVVTREDTMTPASSPSTQPAATTPAQAQTSTARLALAKPIAATAAMPVARMMPVSMRTTPIRAAATPLTDPSLSQDGESIRAAALVFLTQQAAGLPGKPEITVAQVFPRGLAACVTLEPFMPPGARKWGHTTVGMRCSGEHPWTLYLQAHVSVQATYYLAARAMAPGEVLTSADLVSREGDLTTMPQAIVTDPSQAVGAVTLSRLAAGFPLRSDLLRGAGSISIGQTVQVVTGGNGFSISSAGSAMNNAAPGQQIRVKTPGGQIISGVVKDGSTVEVNL